MKPEHKILIEKIVLEFQNSENGYINSNTFTKFFDEDHKLRLALTTLMTNELNLIYKVNSLGYRLTKDGWDFKSFAEIDKIDKKKIEKENAEIENIATTIKLNKWLLKTKWLPLILSLAAILMSVYFSIQDKNKQDELEMKILENEKAIDTLKMENMILRKRTVLFEEKIKETSANSRHD